MTTIRIFLSLFLYRGTLVIVLPSLLSTCLAGGSNNAPRVGAILNHPSLPGHGLDMNQGFIMNDMFETSQQLRTMSPTMLHYVMSKGCDYVNAFVKGHYYKHWSGNVDDNHDDGHIQHDHHKTCDWKPWMEKTCALYHVPMELCCALMDCGASRSLYALGAPRDMIENCNMTDAVMAIHEFGKRDDHRHPDPPSTSRMCGDIQAFIFGKRDDSLNVVDSTGSSQKSQFVHQASSDRLSTSTFRNVSTKPDSSPNGGQPKRIRRWCKVFSRNIGKRYHLHETRYVRRSAYWLVDIYKTAIEHHVPNSYTHGLVGCGIDYVMKAFNVEKWQTALYKLVS